MFWLRNEKIFFSYALLSEGLQPGSLWVPYGLAHVNKMKQIEEEGADPGFLPRGQIYKGGFELKSAPDNFIVYADFLYSS